MDNLPTPIPNGSEFDYSPNFHPTYEMIRHHNAVLESEEYQALRTAVTEMDPNNYWEYLNHSMHKRWKLSEEPKPIVEE